MECISLADKSHFIALASRMMRHILVDHARARGSSMRRHQKVELNTNIDDGHHRIDLNLLDAALLGLRALDEQPMEQVEERLFGGMTTAVLSDKRTCVVLRKK